MSAAASPILTPALNALVADYLRVLTNERGSSPHTLRAYERELHGFTAFIAESYGDERSVELIEHTEIRAYLGILYDRGLSKTSVARALAAIRSWFKWLARTGRLEQNAASLVSTPRLPKHLPRVPSIEQLNRAVDSVSEDAASWPARDAAILELLYGCGIRNAELVGLNLDDIHWANEAILIRARETSNDTFRWATRLPQPCAPTWPSAPRCWPRPRERWALKHPRSSSTCNCAAWANPRRRG